mgnify:CR=1 FL=1
MNGFIEEEYPFEGLFKVDFFVPKLDYVIEINGMEHFYPFTTQMCNYTNFKGRMINRQSTLTNLNNPVMMGWMKAPEKKALLAVLKKNFENRIEGKSMFKGRWVD